MLTRTFDIELVAGATAQLVINVNQYDHSEQWLFNCYMNGVLYKPNKSAIVGLKADKKGIINSGTVNDDGQVVIQETQQMTAAVGDGEFELQLDGEVHGTANFIVRVERNPADDADYSESDISMIETAIEKIQNVEEQVEEAKTAAASAITSAETATTKAGEAKASAATASEYAAQASTSASNASTSEANAKASADDASTSATTATTKAQEASTSATSASTAETNAKNYASSAETSATSASSSATNAKTSETNAGNYASQAQAVVEEAVPTVIAAVKEQLGDMAFVDYTTTANGIILNEEGTTRLIDAQGVSYGGNNLEDSLIAMASNINSAIGASGSNSAKIYTLEENYTDLASQVATNVTSIATNASNINALQSELDSKHLVYTDIIVPKTAGWTTSTTISGYEYEYTMALTGMTADYTAELFPTQETNDEGVLSVECETTSGGITIYASAIPEICMFNLILATKVK